MRRASHKDGMAGGRRARERGLTLVELTISVSLLSMILGAFVLTLHHSSESFMTGCAKGVVSARMNQAFASLLADLRETSSADVHVTTSGMEEGLCAVLLPSARDSAGVFRTDSAGRPAWQAVIVYCPFVTAAGVRQLRRYVCYADTADFPFRFHATDPISPTEIRLAARNGSPLVLNRESGNPNLPVGREFLVFSPGLTAFGVEPGGLVTVSLGLRCISRGKASIHAEDTALVATRN